MGVGLGVNDVPIVGEPVAFGAGFIALLIVCFSTYIGAVLLLLRGGGRSTARRSSALRDRSSGSGSTTSARWRGRWSPATAGWAIGRPPPRRRTVGPPLLGLAGAALIAAGNPWAVLLAADRSSRSSPWSRRGTLWRSRIPLLVVLGLGAALLYGSGAAAGLRRGLRRVVPPHRRDGLRAFRTLRDRCGSELLGRTRPSSPAFSGSSCSSASRSSPSSSAASSSSARATTSARGLHACGPRRRET